MQLSRSYRANRCVCVGTFVAHYTQLCCAIDAVVVDIECTGANVYTYTHAIRRQVHARTHLNRSAIKTVMLANTMEHIEAGDGNSSDDDGGTMRGLTS